MKSSIYSFLWLASEKILRIFTGVFVGLWLARYLGPENYGMFMYAIAWVSLFNAFAWFGVGENVIQNLVKNPGNENELLGAAFLIRLLGSLCAGALAVVSLLMLRHPDQVLLSLVILASLAIPFAETPAVIFLYFQSRLAIARPVLLQNIVRLLGAGLRVMFIVGGLSLPWFGIALLLESIGIFAVLFGYYWISGGRVQNWVFNWRGIGLMLRQGTPVALAALVSSLSARTDQLMLGWFATFKEVGIYSAVLRFSEVWWTFAPMIMNSLSPKYIFNITDDDKLRENIAKIMAIMSLLGLVPIVSIIALGQYAVPLLLGEQYAAALPVLYIHIFIAALVFFDAPLAQYLLSKNRQRQLIGKSVFVLIANFILNFALVPKFGSLGAAIATLSAYILTMVIFYRLFPSYRDLAEIQNHAILKIGQLIIHKGRFKN